MKKFIDTNILLNKKYLDALKDEEHFLVSSETIIELENIKTSCRDEDTKYKARNAVRFLRDNEKLYSVILVNKAHYKEVEKYGIPVTADSLIVACAASCNDCEFVSDDILCRLIARDIFKIPIGYIGFKNTDSYLGYKIVSLTDEELSEFYSGISTNRFNCLINEYLIIKNVAGDIVDKFKWDGNKYSTVNYRQLNNSFSGKIKPKNIEQELAFDLLQDGNIKVKVLRGKAGTGKDFLMSSTALDLIGRKKSDKIIWIRNNVEVKNSRPIGFLPGTKDDKLKPTAMPFADHVGGEYSLDILIGQGKVVIEHFGTIRGRDLKNSIVICSEAENMTREHIQLLISRISEGSELWINGDVSQVDDDIFENNSGITSVIEALRGKDLFGYVELQKTERGKVAEMAELLNL
jgi:predicted ribonuclease YlaK